MSDPRFARLRTDPRFRKPKRSKQKVVVDERFKEIFEDDSDKKSGKRKSKGGRVDKYGRPISDTLEKEDLRRFYRLESQDEHEDAKDAKDKNIEIVDHARGQVLLESSDEENGDDGDADNQNANQESEVDDGEVILGRHASKPIPVLAEEEADEYLEVDLNEDEDTYADLDAQAAAYTAQHASDADNEEPEQEKLTGIKTNRIAVVNLDWDHVRASHLFKIFSSLVSPTAPSASVAVNATTTSTSKDGDEKLSNAAKIIRGKVRSVRVYPSEFGKKRLKKEEAEGPPKEIFKKSRRDDVLGSFIQEDDGNPYDEKALRKYQLERLRYYYAIVTCDTVEAAAHIVAELDDTELERSANVFDLSFVPDDMAFNDEFRDEATSVTEAGNTAYKPLDFSTDALRHSKVTLKWDEDDPERSKITRRTLSRKEIEEGDFRAYIASSSSEEEDGNDKEASGKNKVERERLRKLLLGGGGAGDPDDANPFVDEDKGAEGDVEITFMPGLSEANANTEEETTIDAYKRKQKERRLARKKEKKEKENQGGDKAKDAKSKKGKFIDDDFFAAGSESENEEEAVDARKNSKSKKKTSKEDKDAEAPAETRPATEAELALLATPDDVSSERQHFDMKAILKAEKARRRKRDRKKKKKGKGEDEEEIQEDFRIDVKDERFRALHEDHTFAIDPSNPHFKKTKSMATLLEERARRQSGKDAISETNEPSFAKKDSSGTSQSLQSLVESVKRKSSGIEGKGIGKRRKL